MDMEPDYWWCWLGIGINLAYIVMLNVLFMLFLAFLPAYGANATVAKTAEELDDRRAALYGDGRDRDDVVIDLPAYENGHAGNGIHTANGTFQVSAVVCLFWSSCCIGTCVALLYCIYWLGYARLPV